MGIYWFLNNANVKEQIHADTNVHWKMCNPDVSNKWVANSNGAIDIYKKILREQHDLRIVMFLLNFSGLYQGL